jgi:hypothetical protein
MTKIYVRERMKTGSGAKQPRYRIAAISGENKGLQISAAHFRRGEIEQIAKDAGAEVVYLEPED